jgi:RNA polymerase sigma factor (sigma-70 family)
MPTSRMSEEMQHLRQTVLQRDGAGLSDGDLLGRFLSDREEAAFAALVRRHGPMVWGVCRRILTGHQDAEDAFQATFLVLLRKANSIRPRDRVANWLHGVALRTALKARALASRRKERERPVSKMVEPALKEPPTWLDLQPLLDEELSRLPDKYRAVIVLCDLECRTRKEAAQHLRVPEGTVAGRLARARALLAKRLVLRGLALSGGLLAAMLPENATATAPAPLVSATIAGAGRLAIRQSAAAAGISAPVAALAEGVLKMMLLAKLKIAAAVVLVAVTSVGLLAMASTAVGHAQPAGFPAKRAKPSGQPQAQGQAPKTPKPVPEPAWRTEFRKTYGLKNGEILKRFTPPFPACRLDYCKWLKKEFFPDMDVDNVVMDYRWDGKNVEFWGLSYKNKDEPYAWTLLGVMGHLDIRNQEVEIDEELRSQVIEGEFVWRTSTLAEKTVPRFEQILREEMKLPIRLTLKEAEREVFIVSGKYQSKPLGNRQPDEVDLFAQNRDEADAKPGGNGTFDEFLVHVGSYINRRLVKEMAETPKGRIAWYLHNSARVLPGPDPERDPKGVLKNVSLQTGLTFKAEKRKVRVLVVEKAPL